MTDKKEARRERVAVDTDALSRDPQKALASNPIDWFRQASPYIKSYRNTTLVLHIDGELLDSPLKAVMAHDITLLSHLGVRLVLVPGLRTRINRQLQASGIESSVIDTQRVTSTDVLATIRTVAGEARIDLECLLSQGLVNTPMAGAHLSVTSGNFVTAQPLGVQGGVDFGFAGVVRKIHGAAIEAHTASGHIVLLTPIGYSRTGELFNLQSEMLAAETAAALGAEKLVYLSGEKITSEEGNTLAECQPAEIKALLNASALEQTDRRALLSATLLAAQRGVSRIHVLDRDDRNALLQELFTRDGAGTLISVSDFDTVRPATIDDVGGIIELIEPLEQDGTLVPRSREQLELSIDGFLVCEREGMITACAALLHSTDPATDLTSGASPGKKRQAAEIACVATHPAYRGGGRAEELLCRLEQQAKDSAIDVLFVLTTRSGHWFIERGFESVDPDSLPQGKVYSSDRNSRVLAKTIASNVTT